VRAHACIDGIASTRHGDPVTRVLHEEKRERETSARGTILRHGVSDAAVYCARLNLSLLVVFVNSRLVAPVEISEATSRKP